VTHVLHDPVVERSVVLEHLGDGHLLEDRLPRALRLAGPAVDTLVGMDVELIRPRVPVGTRVLVDAVDRTHRHAPGIEAIAAEAGGDVRHDLPPTRRPLHRWTKSRLACSHRPPPALSTPAPVPPFFSTTSPLFLSHALPP